MANSIYTLRSFLRTSQLRLHMQGLHKSKIQETATQVDTNIELNQITIHLGLQMTKPGSSRHRNRDLHMLLCYA